jgi:hypothetical protein
VRLSEAHRAQWRRAIAAESAVAGALLDALVTYLVLDGSVLSKPSKR